jgi:glycolate oxidase iron-sulfur subunit
MQTTLIESALSSDDVRVANEALRSCVHCGFCNATCPTYQLLGNELDGPRGRIYLIKQVLEGKDCTSKTLSHLDRCLTCRACETTCPSGVAYGQLLEIGRHTVLGKVTRPVRVRFIRYMLRHLLPHPQRLGTALRLAPLIGWLLPGTLKRKLKELPALPRSKPHQPQTTAHSRQVLLLAGCAQATIRPDINDTTIRVLEKLGISASVISGSGCCGAVNQHLDAADEARQFMRRNIDAWWLAIEAGAEAIITTASACSLMVKDYGRLLAGDPDYSSKAMRVTELARDVAELIANEKSTTLSSAFRHTTSRRRIALHLPCTAQHGQQLSPALAHIMGALDVELTAVEDNHLCCGAAGTYTVLQPVLSQQLRQNRLQALQHDKPESIITANIGCLLHLQCQAEVPVKHWIELLDSA